MTVLENMLVGGPLAPACATGCAGARNAPRRRPGARAAGAGSASTTSSTREARDISYGQQKLLELAGVLMADPETIMLDEPAGGVNPALIDRIGTLVRELNAEGRRSSSSSTTWTWS